jgi:hypothetical protein
MAAVVVMSRGHMNRRRAAQVERTAFTVKQTARMLRTDEEDLNQMARRGELLIYIVNGERMVCRTEIARVAAKPAN